MPPLKKRGPKPDLLGKFSPIDLGVGLHYQRLSKRHQEDVSCVANEFNPIQSVSIAPTSASATTLPFTLASP